MKTKQTAKLHEQITIPKSFWEEHISHDGICGYFGWTEAEFFQRYTQHQLPMGVNLQAVCGMPYIVFKLADIVAWEQAGFPAQAGALELQSEILHSLIERCREQGVQFPDDIAKAN